MKKRILSIATVLVVILLSSANLIACSFGGRDEILRIYNWEDYLSPDAIPQFETWYTEQTGKRIKVEESGFSTNEQMYTQIASKKADYDLIVPSDYMIAHMRTENLLQPIDPSIVYGDYIEEQDGEYSDDILNDVYSQDILDIIKGSFDPTMQYVVPYLWGTVGILYDPVRGSDDLSDAVHSWDAIFGSQFASKIYMADSVTDAYGIASIWTNSNELKSNNIEPNSEAHKDWVEDTINNVEPENIDKVKQELINQRPNVLAYAVDDANERLATASDTAGWLAMVWSVQAGYAMDDNSDLRYIVPDEGSNSWIDGFVIPKTAKNTYAANYFLKFLLQDDIAYENMDYIGATSPIKSVAEDYQDDLLADVENLYTQLEYYNETGEWLDPNYEYEDHDPDYEWQEWDSVADIQSEIEFQENYIYTLFPPEDVLNRVGGYTDWGDAKNDINMMWIQVKAGGTMNDKFDYGIWIMLALLLASLGITLTYRYWGDRVVGVMNRVNRRSRARV